VRGTPQTPKVTLPSHGEGQRGLQALTARSTTTGGRSHGLPATTAQALPVPSHGHTKGGLHTGPAPRKSEAQLHRAAKASGRTTTTGAASGYDSPRRHKGNLTPSPHRHRNRAGSNARPSPRTSAARQSHGQSQRTHLHKESHEHSTPPAMRRMGQQHTIRARCRASMSRHHPSTRATSPTIQNAPTCTPTARQPSLAPKSRLGVRQCAKRGQPRPRSSRCRRYDLASQPRAHTAWRAMCAPKRKEHKPPKKGRSTPHARWIREAFRRGTVHTSRRGEPLLRYPGGLLIPWGRQ
jgi:hypothetical protein